MAIDGQWRPPQWSKPAMVAITVPAGYAAASTSQDGLTNTDTGVGMLSTAVVDPTTYVFDAVLSLEHEQAITKTKHPVQTGASISSHAYIEPAQLVLYVLMTDVAGSYTGGVNQQVAPYVQNWSGNPSKSVSAYQQMLRLQSARIPLTVTTRLRTYYNMLVDKVTPQEDVRTITGARFRLELGQIFVATTQATIVSTRPNDTNTTGQGSVSVQPPTPAVNNQFGVTPFAPGADPPPPLPPDLGNGWEPVVENGVPGYLTGPNGGAVTPSTPAQDITFVPQYSNSVTAVDVPGAGTYSSNVIQTNALSRTGN